MGSLRSHSIKILSTIGLMLAGTGPSRATVCIWAETRVDQVFVSVCANHARWDFATMLYYKGLARLLGEHAAASIPGSSAKRVEIRVIDPAMNGAPVFAVDQDDRAYKLDCRGRVSLKLFAQGLHYLAEGHGALEFTERPRRPDEEVLELMKEKMIDAVGEIDLRDFEGRRVVVLDLDRLKVVNRDDELFYELDGVTLERDVQDPLPLDLGDGRFLIGSDGAALVYEDGRIVAQREWYRPGIHLPYLCAMVYPSWVNFHHDAGIALTYSRRTSTFYEVDVKYDVWDPASAARKEYVKCGDRSLSRIGFSPSPD